MGIGEAIAERLVSEGATLFLFSRSEDRLQSISNRMHEKHPGSHVYFQAGDIQDYKVVKAAVEDALHKMKGIDILINNVSPFCYCTQINRGNFN